MVRRDAVKRVNRLSLKYLTYVHWGKGLVEGEYKKKGVRPKDGMKKGLKIKKRRSFSPFPFAPFFVN
ncbi:hypothetical protein GCM10028818_38650 [Spirosoma horti]